MNIRTGGFGGTPGHAGCWAQWEYSAFSWLMTTTLWTWWWRTLLRLASSGGTTLWPTSSRSKRPLRVTHSRGFGGSGCSSILRGTSGELCRGTTSSPRGEGCSGAGGWSTAGWTSSEQRREGKRTRTFKSAVFLIHKTLHSQCSAVSSPPPVQMGDTVTQRGVCI